MKMIGPVSWNILETLGIQIVAVEDPQALARAQRRSAWRRRRQDQTLPVHQYPK
jgi:hypothetical protein